MPHCFSRSTACLCAAALLLLAASAGAGEHDRAFSPGEKLTFQIKWGPFPAGEAVLEVLPMERQDGTPVYHFAMEVKTNAFLDLILLLPQPDRRLCRTANEPLAPLQTKNTNRPQDKRRHCRLRLAEQLGPFPPNRNILSLRSGRPTSSRSRRHFYREHSIPCRPSTTRECWPRRREP